MCVICWLSGVNMEPIIKIQIVHIYLIIVEYIY
jgi:hypothetical protein